MKTPRRPFFSRLLAAIALICGASGSLWAQVLPAVAPNIANRPAVQLETDSYVYGPGAGFITPELRLSVDRRAFPSPVTLYLFWQNRETGETRYYNRGLGDFSPTEIDFTGTAGSPALVTVPSLVEMPLFGTFGTLGPLPASLPSTPGRYRLVFEIRDGAATQVLARSNAMYNYVTGVTSRTGSITTSETWSNDVAHLLTGSVQVFAPAELTIEPGTVILGTSTGPGILNIRRGATIRAAGTAELPIIFSSDQPVGSRARGDWGGIVISGSAPTNQTSPVGEADSGPFGGAAAGDSSGILRYVRIEYCGISLADMTELPGLGLQGVGNGTMIDHIQIHRCQDDGLDVFGGTVDAKYVLVTETRDDSLDWTFGWQGRLQHLVVLQRATYETRMIEGDNDDFTPGALPRSLPTIANATLVGNGGGGPTDPSEGLLFRRGSGANLTHFISIRAPDEGIRVSDAATLALLGADLRLRNGFFFDHLVLTDDATVQTYLTDPAQNILLMDPQLRDPRNPFFPNIEPLPSSPARTIGALPTDVDSDPFFDSTTWAGGVDPNAPWLLEDWLTFSDN